MANTHRKRSAAEALTEIMDSDKSSLSPDSECDNDSDLDTDSLDENIASDSTPELESEVETDTY